MIFKIELGEKVQDLVSGFEGIITGRLEYFNGCIQYLVIPKVDKDGGRIDGLWVDEPQLKVIKGGIKKEDKKEYNGGSSDMAPIGHGMAKH